MATVSLIRASDDSSAFAILALMAMALNALRSTPTASRILITVIATPIAFTTQQPAKMFAFVNEASKETEEFALSIENVSQPSIAVTDQCADTERASVKTDTKRTITICKLKIFFAMRSMSLNDSII